MHSLEFCHLVWHTSWIYNPSWSLYKYVNQNDLLGKLWEGTLLCYPHMHVRPTQKHCCILVSITGRWKAPADVIFAMQVKEYSDVTKPWKMRKSHEMESGVGASRGGSVTHGRLWHSTSSALYHVTHPGTTETNSFANTAREPMIKLLHSTQMFL